MTCSSTDCLTELVCLRNCRQPLDSKGGSYTELQLLCPDRLTWLLQVNMLMSNKGTVLRADVNGRIVMKVFLSGMPDVKLGLNDKLEVRMRT